MSSPFQVTVCSLDLTWISYFPSNWTCPMRDLSTWWQSYFQFSESLPWLFQAQSFGIWRVLYKLKCMFSYLTFFVSNLVFPHLAHIKSKAMLCLSEHCLVWKETLFPDISVSRAHRVSSLPSHTKPSPRQENLLHYILRSSWISSAACDVSDLMILLIS